jgi:organic hydroperoxide reductase OsmC/OhrA
LDWLPAKLNINDSTCMGSETIMNDTHKYRIRATSTAIRSGLVVVDGIEPSIAFSAPPEFKGQAGHWTPEHFLVAAVASCYVSTFSGMAFNSNFEFFSLELETEGIVAQDQAGWRFREVALRPRLTIARSEQQRLASRLLHKAKENCLVGRSLACPVVLEPALIIEERPIVSR